MSEEIEEGLTREEIAAKVSEADPGTLAGACVPTLFSSFLDDEVLPFTIGQCKKPSSATLKPMNGDQLARYKEKLSKFSTVEGANSGDTKFYFEPSTADADLALLMGTVVAMEVYYDKPVKGGGETVEKFPFPGLGAARADFFKKLDKTIRGLLIEDCKRVNGLHPQVPK